ncbi:MAG: DUF4382 domain-containing protein [Nitrososphaerales archaeon]
MAYERKHVVISAIVGILLAGLIIAGTTLLPLVPLGFEVESQIISIPDIPPEITTQSPTTEASKMGTLVLMLTDAPPRTLKYLYIEVDEVRLHMKGNATGEGPVLNFLVTPTVYNVTSLEESHEILGINSVPEGNYIAIWLHIVEANATFTENPSENVTLKLVAQGWLKIPIRYKVHSGELTAVVLDFDLGQTHVSQGMVLTPVIRPEKVLGP